MFQPPSEVWDKDGDVPLEEEEEQPPRFYERELDAYKDSLTPVDPEKVAVEEVNHREYLREVSTTWEVLRVWLTKRCGLDSTVELPCFFFRGDYIS